MRTLFFLGVLAMASPRSGPELVAHRGSSDEAPENTMLAMELGFRQADACELDIHLSKDGQVVVMHDASTKRTAGIDKPIAHQTLAELKALDAGRFKGEQFAGERIPTLSEVLAIVPDGKRLFIEIKCGAEVIPALVAAIEEAKKKPEQTALIAFNRETLRQAKLKLPKLQAYWLASAKPDPKTQEPPALDDLIRKCKEAGLDGLDLDAKFPFDADFVGRIRAANLKCYAYTVNDPEAAKRLAAAGVDGITTDKPLKLRESLSR